MTTAAAALAWAAPPAAAGAGEVTITEFRTDRPFPVSITNGPDGNLWFTESGSHTIGRITPTGVVTHFEVPISPGVFSNLNSVTAGPDGALWFTDQFIDRIGRMTTAGQVTGFFTIPPHDVSPLIAPSGVQAGAITLGPDRNLWFTESAANQIVRLTAGGVFTQFPLPVDPQADPDAGPDVAFPVSITSGPDGALWFTETRFGGGPRIGNKIGRITTAGAITEFPIPTQDSLPGGITQGPDGALWFTEQGGDIFDPDLPAVDKIGRITTAGAISEFPAPAGSNPPDITTGADGNLWFTERGTSRIARMTVGGAITELPTPTLGSRPRAITAGPDGRVWFTEVSGVRVGRTSVLGCTARLSGRVVGPLNITVGATCLSGAQVTGSISVGPGASLFVQSSQVIGGISARGPGVVRLCGSQVRSGVSIDGATDVVELGNPAAGCQPDDIGGAVALSANLAPTDVVSGSKISGTLSCVNNSPAPTLTGPAPLVLGGRTGQCA